MIKHRIAFVGAWLAITIALVAFPGSETHDLAAGLIIGWWPFALLEPLIGDAVHAHPLFVYVVTFLVTGATVGLCAWLIDAARLTKQVWIALLLAVTAGAVAAYALNDYGFEAWQNSPAVAAAMNSPEVSYEPTRWDFNKAVVIPTTLLGGLWGLYVAAALGLCYSVGVIVFRKRHLAAAGHS